MTSQVSTSVKRLGMILRTGAEYQVAESEGRHKLAAETYWPLISGLLVSDFQFPRSYETALKFFGKDEVKFGAIDGSEDQRLQGGLAVFWAGSYAATGTVAYRRDSTPRVQYDAEFIGKEQGLASCVPIYVDAIGEVDPQSTLEEATAQSAISRTATESSVVDNSTIADWIMLFSELYLAYELAKREEYGIILLDRSLSGTLSNLILDTSRRTISSRYSAICDFGLDGVTFDRQELDYGRYHTVDLNDGLPPRGDYLRYATIYLLEKIKEPLSVAEIAEQLGLSDEDRIRRLKLTLRKIEERGYIKGSGERYSVNPRYRGSWDRLRRLVDAFGHRFFQSESGNPLRIERPNPRWLTTLDLAFLSLFTMNLLVEESFKRRILLVGITKDTTARDFISHLIPVCITMGKWKGPAEPVATTDRTLLQAISVLHHSEIPVPWATVEYDTAFQTIIPNLEKMKDRVSGAVRNRIILEERFLRSYIQLDKSESDDQFRSNVLLIDRLYHKEFEDAPVLKLRHEYGTNVMEEVNPVLWLAKDTVNRVQELLLITLKAMGQPSLPEVFGHNKPLFIADKVAKAQRKRAADMVAATGHWLVSHPKLRRFTFYMNTFRERRSQVEGARNRA